MTRKYLVYALFVFMLGCSENDSNTIEEQTQESVFDVQTEAIDKAEALEQQIMDAAEQQRQTIEEMGG